MVKMGQRMKQEDFDEILRRTEELKAENKRLTIEKWMWQRGILVWLICVTAINVIALFFNFGKWMNLGISLVLLVMILIMKKRGEALKDDEKDKEL